MATRHRGLLPRLRVPGLRVPVVDRSLYAATALALLHVTVQTFRDGAAQAGHYPAWLLDGTRVLLVVMALWIVTDTIRGGTGVIRRSSLRVLVAMTLVVGGLSAATASGLADQLGMPWQLHLLVLSSCVAVLAFGMRAGMAVVILIWVEFFILRAPRGVVQAASESAAFLAGGVFCGALIYVVRHGAELVERADRDNERVKETATLVQHRQAASAWWDRFIHDTVLGAFLIAGRSDATDGASISAAAAMASDAIDALHGRRPPSGRGTPDAVLRSHAQSLGLEVTGSVRDVGAPPLVRDEVVNAAKEAITNVSRHADTSRVIIDGHLSEESASLSVRDEGRGFDPALRTDRRGVRESLERRMVVLGGDAQVESSPGQGTIVRLSWHRAAEPRRRVVWPQEPHAALSTPLLLYCALHAVAGLLFGRTNEFWITVTGAILLVVVVLAVIDKRTPDRVVIPTVAMLPLVVAVLTMIIHPMREPDFRTWFVGACVPIFIGLVMRGHRRLAFGISLATMFSFMLVGHLAGTVALPLAVNVAAQQPVLTLAAIAVSLTLDRSAEHIVRLNHDTTAAAAALAVVRAREAERRRRLDELASDVEPLLRHLARGTTVSTADQVAYRQVEARTRDGLAGRGLLRREVLEAVALARDRGAIAALSSEEGLALPHRLRDLVNDLVARCAGDCGPGSVLTFRLTGTSDAGQCTVAVADPVDPVPFPTSTQPHGPGLTVSESLHEDSRLVTVRWQRG